jgi:hypothetical protein
VSFYNDRIVRHLVHMSMRQPRLSPYRELVVSAAEGRVLELDITPAMKLLDSDPVRSGRLSHLNLKLGSRRNGISPAALLQRRDVNAAAS